MAQMPFSIPPTPVSALGALRGGSVIQNKEAAMVWCRFQQCAGTKVGVPTIFSLVDLVAGVSESRDIEFTWRLTCSSWHR